MDNEQRAFKGVWIPRALWEADDLTWMDKCILAEIDSLAGINGCYATDAALAKRFGVSTGRFSNKLSELREKGYIESENPTGRQRFLRVNPSSDGVNGNREAGLTETVKPLYMDRDTSIDTNLVTKVTKENPEKNEEPKVDRRNPDVTELVEYFESAMNLEMPRKPYQRRAAKTLISKYGLPVAKRAADAVVAARDYQFAPKILSLEDLRDKWNDLAEFYRKRNKPQDGGRGAKRI